MFELKHLDPEDYRRQTRKISLVVIAIFAVLGMATATLLVAVFGEPGGNNFRWNLGGVLAGLAMTVLLVRFKLCSQAWMAPAVYGWQLKRSLMRVTNVMHLVEAGVAGGDADAMKLLRFYHLGLEQMHHLDGNTSGLLELQHQREELTRRLAEHGLSTDQTRLDPVWLKAVKRRGNPD